MKKFFVTITLIFLNIISYSQTDKELISKGLSLNNNSDEEISLYQRAIEINPKNDIGYYNLGCVFFDKKNYDKAIFYFTKALDLKKDPDYYYNLALSYYYVKNDIEAIRLLKDLIKIRPKDYEAVYLLSYIYSLTDNITAKNQARYMLKSILSSREIQLYDVEFIEKVKKLLKELGG